MPLKSLLKVLQKLTTSERGIIPPPSMKNILYCWMLGSGKAHYLSHYMKKSRYIVYSKIKTLELRHKKTWWTLLSMFVQLSHLLKCGHN